MVTDFKEFMTSNHAIINRDPGTKAVGIKWNVLYSTSAQEGIN